MSTLGSIAVLAALVGQAPAGEVAAAKAAERLELMKKSLAVYEVSMLGEREVKLHLEKEPVLRFTNPVGGSKDGTVFLWRDGEERPRVAVQVYWDPSETWLQEFSSLAAAPVVAKAPGMSDWSPSKAGVRYEPLPDASRPAETPEKRLRQMRAIAEEFTTNHYYKRRTWNKLRLLTKPFARYGKEGSSVLDGCLFCFAHGTDPEVLLLVEADQTKDGSAWQFAFAPMTTFAVNASWKGKEVWSLPGRGDVIGNPRETFHVRPFEP